MPFKLRNKARCGYQPAAACLYIESKTQRKERQRTINTRCSATARARITQHSSPRHLAPPPERLHAFCCYPLCSRHHFWLCLRWGGGVTTGFDPLALATLYLSLIKRLQVSVLVFWWSAAYGSMADSYRKVKSQRENSRPQTKKWSHCRE